MYSPGGDLNASELERLRELVAEMPAGELRPREFFIARHGVPALAFDGFPSSIAGLKKNIEAAFPNLAPENPGSRWPKTSLGARRPGGKDITPEQLSRLRNLCDEANAGLRDASAWRVTELKCVEFLRPSLEKVHAAHALPARGSAHASDESVPDAPTPEERQRVNAIMDEFARANLERYLPDVNRPGRDMNFYRRDLREHTLVFMPAAVPEYIGDFRRSLDAALPDLFEWFADDALHVTIRSLRVH